MGAFLPYMHLLPLRSISTFCDFMHMNMAKNENLGPTWDPKICTLSL